MPKHLSSLLFIFIISGQLLNAQIQISGRILSAKDSTTIQGASIYFDGTSIGTSSSPNGHFRLQIRESINSNLIVSSLGYKSLSLQTKSTERNIRFTIYLQENSESLETVFLEDDPWTRKKKLAYFRQEFLGKGTAGKLTKIVNEDDLNLRYSPSKNKLTVSCDEPLIIQNDYLGYKINYNLSEFYISFFKESEEIKGVYYAGSSFFQDIDKIRNRHLNRREESYYGSSLHFMRSIIQNKLTENNFLLYTDDKQIDLRDALLITKTEKYYQAIPQMQKFRVRYGQALWSLVILEDSFSIDEFGNFAPPTSLTMGGFMSSKRVAQMVPLDYDPKE